MGLVLQSTVDTVLPIAETPATMGQGTTTAAPAADGLFANLLAGLSAELEAESNDIEALPGASEEDDGETSAAEMLAALFASTIPLVVVKPAATRADAGTEADGAVTASAQVPALSAAAAEQAPAGTAMPGPETEADAATGSTQADLPAIEKPLAAAASEAPQPGTPTVLQEPESAREPTPPAAEAPPVDAAAGPASEASTEAHSVVRPVGNADNDTAGKDGLKTGRRPGELERAEPRASARGLEHAAANSAVGQLREAQAAATDAPAPADTPPAAPTAELPQQVEQVATTVIEQVEAGGGEARIHLDPVDLGEITIHVRTHKDGVEVQIRAERAEAAQLLRDHTQDLSQLLGQRGLNLSDVNVGLGRGNGQHGWGQDGQPGHRPAAGEFASILHGDGPLPLERHQRLRAAYNPDGSHLYRI